MEPQIKTSDAMSFVDVSDSFKLSSVVLGSSMSLFLHHDSDVVCWSLYYSSCLRQ